MHVHEERPRYDPARGSPEGIPRAVSFDKNWPGEWAGGQHDPLEGSVDGHGRSKARPDSHLRPCARGLDHHGIAQTLGDLHRCVGALDRDGKR